MMTMEMELPGQVSLLQKLLVERGERLKTMEETVTSIKAMTELRRKSREERNKKIANMKRMIQNLKESVINQERINNDVAEPTEVKN